MPAKILPLALALGAMAPVALAEPIVLTEAQMDQVTAGGANITNVPGFFHLEASEGAARVSVLVAGHHGQVEYDLVETLNSLHLVARTSEVRGSDVVGSVAVSVVVGSGDATVVQDIR